MNGQNNLWRVGDSETWKVTLTADGGTCKECLTSVSTTVPGESALGLFGYCLEGKQY